MKKYEEGLVSIITPNFNCEKFISQTIRSVLRQTYQNWEMLIVDDCSSDESFDIACVYGSIDSRIKVIKNEKNSGAALSRNSALDVARGEYITFLDSDDLWEPEKLEHQVVFMNLNNCDFNYTRYDLIGENNESLNKCTRIVDRLTYTKLLHHDFIGCLTAMYRADIAQNIRSFNIKNNNDYGLFLQVLRNCKNAMGLQENLAHYRIRKSSISRKKYRKVKPYYKLMHDYLHLPYLIASYFLLTNILIGKLWKYEKVYKPASVMKTVPAAAIAAI